MNISSYGIVTRYRVPVILACSIVALLLVAGCADIVTKQKVDDFGTTFGTSSEEQGAINWFINTYGDPRNDDNLGPRFIEPMITSAIDSNNLPVNKVTTFPVDGGSVYFFVIYDNFQKGDPITVTWTYLENGKQVSTVQQQAGGDFGRFIVEFQKPDTGWGKGKQEITVAGKGVSGKVDFAIGDSQETTPLPYNPGGTGQTGTGTDGISGSTQGNPSSGSSPGNSQVGSTGAACPTGQIRCSGICVDGLTDSANCGKCGVACAKGESCVAGACFKPEMGFGSNSQQGNSGIAGQIGNLGIDMQTLPVSETPGAAGCRQGFTLCSGMCVNVTMDTANCGKCGVACAKGEMCIIGVCFKPGMGFGSNSNGQGNSGGIAGAVGNVGNAVGNAVNGATASPATETTGAITCNSQYETVCNGKCVGLLVDPSNCGKCGVACANGEVCFGGTCKRPF